MSFRARLFAFLALTGVLPVALLGWLSFSVHRAEVERTVSRAQATIAAEAARNVERTVASGIEGLRLSVGALPLDQLSNAELASVLRIPYRQLSFVDAIALLDAQGKSLAPPVWEHDAQKPDSFSQHDLQALLQRAPVALLEQTGTALGVPYRGSTGTTRVPVALDLGRGRVLAAELSLKEIAGRLADLPGTTFLAAQNGATLAGAAELSSEEKQLVAGAIASRAPLARLVRRTDGTEWLAAAAPVGTMGWAVAVAQPARAALSGAVRVRVYTVFWAAVALVLTGVLGMMLARGLSAPVRELSQGVRALAEGRYDQKVAVESHDELGQLADGFNQMVGEIRRRDDEIRAWNSELQQRVEHRTAELKMAQDQILRTRRLAAIGSLGAGIAHELNNPLTAVAGLISLARKQLGDGSPQSDTLKQALEQARRVSKIVSDLRQFAEQERSDGGRRFSLEQPVQSALELYAEEMREKRIDVRQELKPGLREAQGDPVQIQQVIAHLLQNAIAAMPQGGELRIGLTDVGGDALKLTVSDTGKGIAPEIRERIFDPFFSTKDGAAGVGLGLSISHSIVEAHHGKLLVDSVPGRGATFTVLLPAAAPAAHLV
ncbi:MAG TPA: ATP-binding protein [Myxococcales bacterium]|nr:ATP-binding protein [Myxococcales bacterium]